METKDTQSRLRAIAALTLKAMHNNANPATLPSVEALTSALLASKELKDLATPSITTEGFLKKEVLRLKKELGALQQQHKKITEKRRELAGQLDRAEGQNTRCMTLIQRAIPALAQLARPKGNQPLQQHLDRITDLLSKNAAIEDLEPEFHRLKEVNFRDEVTNGHQKPDSPKKTPIFGLFKRPAPSAQEDPLLYFRNSTMELVEELRLNLDKTALKDLDEIVSRLSGMRQVEDFLPIRQKLLVLLKGYLSRINSERKQAAAFIFEVSERLQELEQQMFRSIAVARESQNASIQLTTTLENEMNAFQETVDLTRSLEELKSSIMERISSIKQVIENSRRNDTTRLDRSDSEVSALKKSLDLMKNEIKSAKAHSQTLEAQLLSDPLTQAFNRRAYDQRIIGELERFHRYQSIFSMLVLDVDHFKDINDRFGHSVGDLCLKGIINRIGPLLRKNDFLGRYGGEEFVIILPETGREGAQKVADTIRTHIEKTEFLHKAEKVKVTISLGVTQVLPSDDSVEAIFERADKAMYQAKQSGRNRVAVM